jgi:hypothetical protein
MEENTPTHEDVVSGPETTQDIGPAFKNWSPGPIPSAPTRPHLKPGGFDPTTPKRQFRDAPRKK